MFITIDSYGQFVPFNTLKDALMYVRNTARYDKNNFVRVYDAKEVFNTGCIDAKSLLEKEPIEPVLEVRKLKAELFPE